MLLSELIRHRYGVTNKSLLEDMDNASVFNVFDRDETLVEMGDVQTKIGILVSGALASSTELEKYFIEVIAHNQGDVCVGEYDLTQRSSVRIFSLMTTELFLLDSSYFFQWMQQYKVDMYNLLEKLNIVSFEWHRAAQKMRTLSATSRYEWFTENYKDVADNIRQKDIAAYLGVSVEWLSKTINHHTK